MGESQATYQQVDEVEAMTERIKRTHPRLLAAATGPMDRVGKERWEALTQAKTPAARYAADLRLDQDLVLLFLDLFFTHTSAADLASKREQKLVNDVLTAAWFVCHGAPWGTTSITVRRATAVNFYVGTRSGNVSKDRPVSVEWVKANSPWSAQI